eukprot:gnl/TRDRNA2_/TRDRNA2_196734_c0_seq1.p1 gnl/TRDRNA2_/TRDRNA2_196734_c0~~gnl/TRDRNA2_/TRDRNA2_196734_c0_seq1.p1  ORF type:complete len:302 (+),score=73.91 gnl/TRDRNA2_/TRDRNA2_196734_c0_seq1:57-962(+)
MAAGTTRSRTVTAEERSRFERDGYVVLRSFLETAEIQQLEAAVAASAPNESLREQYVQADDPCRYEFMLNTEAGRLYNQSGRLVAASANSDPEEVKRAQEKLEAELKAACTSEDAPVPVLDTAFDDAVAGLSRGVATLHRADSFCIVSEPGSLDQTEHTDSVPDPEAMNDEEWQNSLHYIGIMTPLVSSTEACGKTGIVPGSHVDGALRIDSGKELQVRMDKGDLLMLDGRTVHRGLANPASSGIIRKIGFFTFIAPSLRDGNSLAYGQGLGIKAAKRKRKGGMAKKGSKKAKPAKITKQA